MTPTTTYALEQAFITALHELVPRFEPMRSERWKHTPGPRSRGTAMHLLGTAPRSFDLIWEPSAESRLWYGNGTAYSARLRICTSYANIDPNMRDHMISEDGVDLVRMFMQLTEPTVPGFAYAVYQRTGQTFLDDQANAMVEHLFDVHWSQDTD